MPYFRIGMMTLPIFAPEMKRHMNVKINEWIKYLSHTHRFAKRTPWVWLDETPNYINSRGLKPLNPLSRSNPRPLERRVSWVVDGKRYNGASCHQECILLQNGQTFANYTPKHDTLTARIHAYTARSAIEKQPPPSPDRIAITERHLFVTSTTRNRCSPTLMDHSWLHSTYVAFSAHIHHCY